MTDEQFEAFFEAANSELREKQAKLSQEYAIGSLDRWWFEQATEKLQFFNQNDQIALEADIVDVGSYSPKSRTWMWAWSNQTVLPLLRQKAAKLKELERVTGIELFGREDAFTVKGESMAWELTAMAVKHLGAMGCYRAPSSTGGPHTFLAITSIRAVLNNAL